MKLLYSLVPLRVAQVENHQMHTHTHAAVCDGDFQPERAGLERQTVAGEAEPL